MTCDPIQSSKVQGWGNFDVAQLVCFYRDVNVQWTIGVLKAAGWLFNLPLAGGRSMVFSALQAATARLVFCDVSQ